MASYLELFTLRSNSDLQDKMSVAVVKKAQSLLDKSTPTADEVAWADAAIDNPRAKALSLLNYVLAKNSDATVDAITGGGQTESEHDSLVQSNVDAAVDALITGGVV